MYDVIVAGLGAHGSSAAYHLASRGASVVGFDRFARGHTLGSSGGLSRIIRLSYYEHPDYVPLLRRAWTRWRDLERESGDTLLTETGGLYAGDPTGELVSGALLSARTHHLEHEVLDASALRRRYPLFEWPDGWQGVFEKQAGWLAPELCIETHLRLAEDSGATLRFDEPVERWESTPDGVRVTTSTGTFDAKKLVIAAGAWESQLAPSLAQGVGRGRGASARVAQAADAARERRETRREGLHVHEHARRELHRRPIGRSSERRRRIGMLGPRVQVLERDRRDPRGPRPRWRN